MVPYRGVATITARVGGKLSRFEEARGWEWLIYNPIHFLHFHEAAKRDASAVFDVIEASFPEASSFVDVGAGSGAYAAEGTRRGHPSVALERDRFGRFLARRQGVDARRFDIRSVNALGRFDLAYCFEVAEHLPPDLGDRLVAFLAASGREILFTAAPPRQGGTGHINEQPPEYWEERFARHGRQLNQRKSDDVREALAARALESHWLARNASVYR